MSLRNLLSSIRFTSAQLVARAHDLFASENMRPEDAALATLGERVLFSASPLPAELPTDTADVEASDASAQSSVHEVFFVADGQAEQLASFANSEEVEVIRLGDDIDGIEQITSALAGYEDLDAVHLIGGGDDAGSLRLGNTLLTDKSVVAYATDIVEWRDSLGSNAELLIRGLDPNGERTNSLLDSLEVLTEASASVSGVDQHDDTSVARIVLSGSQAATVMSDADVIQAEEVGHLSVEQNSPAVSIDSPTDSIAVGPTDQELASPWHESNELTTTDSEAVRELIFIDAGAPDYGQFVDDLLKRQAEHRDFDFVLLDSSRNGIAQVTEALSEHQNLDAIHFVSHGNSEGFQLGGTWIDSTSVDRYQGVIAGWQNALAGDADILIYGCDLASSQNGRDLVHQMGALTGADVAGSDDLTGHEELGGDWELEYRIGDLDSDIVFSADVMANWYGTLGTTTVTTTDDVVSGDADLTSIDALNANPGTDGVISLREAIIAANANADADTITLGPGVFDLTINGGSEEQAATGDLDIQSTITIVGAGAGETTIDGPADDRVFAVLGTSSLTLQNLTVTGGNTNGAGGGVYVSADSTLQATDVVFSGNTAGTFGGGVFGFGDLTLNRTSIVNNTATTANGGGIAINGSGSTLFLTNATVSGNVADDNGGGIWISSGSATLDHSTIADNTSGVQGGGFFGSASVGNSIFADNTSGSGIDATGTIVSAGFNIFETSSGFTPDSTDLTGVDPGLQTLRVDASTGQYFHDLDSSSIALDATSSAQTVDQRNQLRDANPDIGAHEFSSISDLSSGIELNTDGGNDAYLISQGGLSQNLTATTVEVRFAADLADNGTEPTLFSYNVGTEDILSVFYHQGAGGLELDFGTGGFAYATSYDYLNELFDGDIHTLSVTWENASGSWAVYVDGQLTDSGTGLAQNQTLDTTSGQFVLGNEQDGSNAGYDPNQRFSGTMYDVRIWNEARSAADIALNYQQKIPTSDLPGSLVANWQMDGFNGGEVVDVVGGNNLSTSHATGDGFRFSETVEDLHISEAANNGSNVGFVVPTTPEIEFDPAIISAIEAAEGVTYNAATNKFYKVVTVGRAFDAASEYAQDQFVIGAGGQLVTIRSAAENTFVQNLADSSGVASLWLGGTDVTDEGVWRWQQDGKDADQFATGAGSHNGAYTNWGGGEPNNGGSGENHVMMGVAGGNWNDAIASANLRSVIEWDANEVLGSFTSALTDDANGRFAINEHTGEITVADKTQIDFDVAQSHEVTVRVTNAEGETYSEVMSIAIDEATPTDLSSGIELNSDGGNDAYLFANNTAPALSSATIEVAFATDTPNTDMVALYSHAVASDSNEFLLGITPAGEITLVRATTSATTVAIPEIYDGNLHHIAATWDSNNGDMLIYLDGELILSETDNSTGSIDAGGTIVIGQDQDSVGGGFQSNQAFSGTIHDVRLWDNVRSGAEIAYNYQSKLDLTASEAANQGLLYNWQMDGFNGSDEVVDVVSGNNLSVGHATGTGYTASTPVADLHVAELSANGTVVGHVTGHTGNQFDDLVTDGLFLKVNDPGNFQTYSAGQTFGDWTVRSGTVDVNGSVNFEDSPLGGRSVDLNGTSNGGMYHTLSTEENVEYQVVFALSGNFGAGEAVKDLRVSIAGTDHDYSISEPSGWSTQNLLWEHRSFTFTANSTSHDLDFLSLDGSNSHGAIVSDIQVFEIPKAVSYILANDPSLTYNAATGKFYRFVDTNVDINTALSDATSESNRLNSVNGQLVTIQSQYENSLILNYATSSSKDIWLGATDINADGNWNWLEGTTESDEQFWSGGAGGTGVPGEYASSMGLSQTAGEDYLRLNQAGGGWNDDTPTGQHAYVIEWDASEVLSNFSYTLLNDADGRFAIDAETGEITVADGGNSLDYELDTSHDVTVRVTDAAGEIFDEVMTIQVDDLPGDNIAPTFDSAPNGIIEPDYGVGFSDNEGITLQADGKILTAGDSDGVFRVARHNPDGTLDTSFGDGNGFTKILLDGFDGRANSISVMDDGRIVITGLADNTVNGTQDLAVVRLLADGSLDTSFSSDGVVLYDNASNEEAAKDHVVLGNDAIITVGTIQNGGVTETLVTKHDASGGVENVAGLAIGLDDTIAQAAALHSNGQIYITGYSGPSPNDIYVARFNDDGTLDTTFGGGNGYLTYDIGGGRNDVANDIQVQSDGKLVITGYSHDGSDRQTFVMRVNADGTADDSFNGPGNNGILMTNLMVQGQNLQIDSNGDFIIGGHTGIIHGANQAVLKVTSSGSVDTTFGTNGVETHAPSGLANDSNAGVALTSDGKILLANTRDGWVYQTNADGSLDTSFGTEQTLNGNPTFVEGGPAVVLDADVEIFDVELSAEGDYQGSSLRIERSGGANAEDVFVATGNLVFDGNVLQLSSNPVGIVTQSAGSLNINFGLGVSNAEVNEVMRSIAYQFAGDSPPASVDLQWTFDDGNTGSQGTGGARSAVGNTVVEIVGTNDAPTFGSTVDDSPPFVEGGWTNSVQLDADVQIFDAELSTIDDFGGSSLTLQRVGGANNDDTFRGLTFDGTQFRINGISPYAGTYTSGGGQLVLNFWVFGRICG